MQEANFHLKGRPVLTCKWHKQAVLCCVRFGMKKWVICFLFVCLGCTSALWAQAFQDLDFESATLVPVSGPSLATVEFDPAFPGWNGFAGTNQLDTALYDRTFLDSTGISIIDTNPLPPGVFGSLIDGNYTAVLQAGVYNGFTPTDVSLSQTGLVPSGTKSLSFLATPSSLAVSNFAVSLGGTNLNLISIPVTNENYTLYEADVSAFAGLVEELQFTLFAQDPHVSNRYLSLDDIMFSPDAIPEPSTVDLVMVGVAALGLWRWARLWTSRTGRLSRG